MTTYVNSRLVGKHLTDREWHEYRNNVQRIVGVFYRQHILVIDGKYSSDDGLSTAAMINSAVIFRKTNNATIV